MENHPAIGVAPAIGKLQKDAPGDSCFHPVDLYTTTKEDCFRRGRIVKMGDFTQFPFHTMAGIYFS